MSKGNWQLRLPYHPDGLTGKSPPLGNFSLLRAASPALCIPSLSRPLLICREGGKSTAEAQHRKDIHCMTQMHTGMCL